MLESALKEVGDSFPVVADVLIHERDQYLATKIAQAKGPKVVAVLGAAHVPGVSALIESGKLADLNELDSLPPKSIWGKVDVYKRQMVLFRKDGRESGRCRAVLH